MCVALMPFFHCTFTGHLRDQIELTYIIIIPTYNDRVAIDFCNNLASLAVINAKCAGTNFCVGLIQLSFRTIVFTQYMQRCFQSKYYISIKLCGGFAL